MPLKFMKGIYDQSITCVFSPIMKWYGLFLFLLNYCYVCFCFFVFRCICSLLICYYLYVIVWYSIFIFIFFLLKLIILMQERIHLIRLRNDENLTDYIPPQGWTDIYLNSHTVLNSVCSIVLFLSPCSFLLFPSPLPFPLLPLLTSEERKREETEKTVREGKGRVTSNLPSSFFPKFYVYQMDNHLIWVFSILEKWTYMGPILQKTLGAVLVIVKDTTMSSPPSIT